MFKNYLKIAFRNTIRQKSYSFINIAGLTIGLTCFILILLYVRYELNYESQHLNADNIYRTNIIMHHPNRVFKSSHSMVPLGPSLKTEIPNIVEFTRILDFGKSLVCYQDKKFNENNLVIADQGFFNLFTIPVISGNVASALTDKFSVVITESMAEKYFGDQNPVNQTLIVDNQLSLNITAVIEDFPKNTNISADFIISFNTVEELVSESFFNNWVTTRLLTFILLPENQDVVSIVNQANKVMTAHSSTEVERSLEVEQFSRIHLYSDISAFGDIQYIYLFMAIGILILLIASINYMNLATARSARRANEVGLRKVVGANHQQLVKQFLGESVLMSFISLLFSLFIVYNIFPLFKNITGQDLLLPSLTDWQFYGLLFSISLGIGLISGSYPAFYLSAFTPGAVLKGKQGARGRNANLRKILVVLQFSIAITLIIATLTISDQLQFMRTINLGFQKDRIVVVPVSGPAFDEDSQLFKQELLRNPNINAVAGSRLLPSRIGMYNNVTWEGAGEDESIALIQNKIDYDFLDTYEIEIIKGRNFSREYSSDILDYSRDNEVGAVLLNEEAVRRFGWQDPINKKVIQTFGTQRYYLNVVGVIKDFNFESLHNKIRPLSLFLNPADIGNFSIKIESADMQKTISHIRETWKRFNPEYPFEYYFLDETFANSYRSEARMQELFSYFSLLGIFISCLGLLGLAAFAAEQRTKEIGVRKVLGASISNILVLLSSEFSKLILISNIIAWPLAWFYLNYWLDEFAYRTSIGWWFFILAGGLALLIALITVCTQAIRAALANPVAALKYE